MDEDQLVVIDEKPFVVTKNEDGDDIAIPVDDNYALVRIREAESNAEIAKTKRTKHRADALVWVVFFAGLFSWCVLT